LHVLVQAEEELSMSSSLVFLLVTLVVLVVSVGEVTYAQGQPAGQKSSARHKDWRIRNGKLYVDGKWVFLKIGKPLRNFADGNEVDKLIADLDVIQGKNYNCLELNCYWHHFDFDGDGVPDHSLEPLSRLIDAIYERGMFPCLSVETYGVGGGQIPKGFWEKHPDAIAINDKGQTTRDTEYGVNCQVPSIFCNAYREAAHVYIRSIAKGIDTRKLLYFETTVEPQYMGIVNLCYSHHAKRAYLTWLKDKRIDGPSWPEAFPVPESFKNHPTWNRFRAEFLAKWINDDAAAFREIAGKDAYVAVDYLETDGPDMVNRLGDRKIFIGALECANVIQVNWHWHFPTKAPNRIAYKTVREVMRETGRDWAISEHMTFNASDYDPKEAPTILRATLENGTRFGWEFVSLGASTQGGFTLYNDDWTAKPLIAVVDDNWEKWLEEIKR